MNDAQLITERPKLRRALIAPGLILALLLVLGVKTLFLDGGSDSSSIVALNLSSVPDGISAHMLRDTPVFVVRDGRDAKTFLTDPQHLPGEHVLWWCPKELVFASPTHGEVFDIRGEAIAGPASRGLTRLHTQSDGDSLRIDLSKREPSTNPNRRLREPAKMMSGNWDSGSSAFCQGALRSDRL